MTSRLERLHSCPKRQ